MPRPDQGGDQEQLIPVDKDALHPARPDDE
jgi:hypothetical protein